MTLGLLNNGLERVEAKKGDQGMSLGGSPLMDDRKNRCPQKGVNNTRSVYHLEVGEKGWTGGPIMVFTFKVSCMKTGKKQ